MPKLKAPLLSLGASGSLARLITFVRRLKTDIVERKPIPTDAKSPAQLSWRHMYQKAVALWHALSAEEKQEWETKARPKHMTGFAWFMSQCLRPNPGIYLPLQGGTMSGDIDMAKNRLLKLPLPTDGQEAASKTYVDTAAGGYTEGARAYHSTTQEIPNIDFTALAFDSERYDTDNIHDPTTNNSRLTCKTAGKYVISAAVGFFHNATGIRRVHIWLNGSTPIGWQDIHSLSDTDHYCTVSTIWDMAVNDYVEVRVFQSSGGALNVLKFDYYSAEFMMQRIG